MLDISPAKTLKYCFKRVPRASLAHLKKYLKAIISTGLVLECIKSKKREFRKNEKSNNRFARFGK
jgi:hypothetical protein